MNLVTKRLSKNMTQSALAKKLNVSRTTVTMWEKEKSVPNATMLKKIAQVLNCTVDELLKESETE